jgi:predicted choloylglycine hydrolase
MIDLIISIPCYGSSTSLNILEYDDEYCSQTVWPHTKTIDVYDSDFHHNIYLKSLSTYKNISVTYNELKKWQ